jgi:hypothetical protein
VHPSRYPGALRTTLPLTYMRETLRARIIEVYRRCYEESPASKQDKVIGDFVALFPALIFEANWLAKLLRWRVASRDYLPNGPTNRLLRALANGFRRAAESSRHRNRHWRHAEVEAARSFRPTLQSRLSEWGRGWERKIPTPEWINEQAAKKAAELVETHPRLMPHTRRLQEMLARRKYYDASVFIAAKVFGVRERDLESGQSHLRD